MPSPSRVAVAYQRRVDWIYSARQAISSLSRIWGGMGAVALPLNDQGAIADELSPPASGVRVPCTRGLRSPSGPDKTD